MRTGMEREINELATATAIKRFSHIRFFVQPTYGIRDCLSAVRVVGRHYLDHVAGPGSHKLIGREL